MKRPDPVFVLFDIPHLDRTLFQGMISIWLNLFLRKRCVHSKEQIYFMVLIFRSEDLARCHKRSVNSKLYHAQMNFILVVVVSPL